MRLVSTAAMSISLAGSCFSSRTTAEMAPINTTIGQPRAAEAIAFALERSWTTVTFDHSTRQSAYGS